MADPAAEERLAASAGGARLSGNRILLWSGVVIGVLLAAAVVFSFTRDTTLDAGTPEGVVQRYLSAMIDGRRGAARSYLSERLQRECAIETPQRLRDGSYRIEWIETTVEGSTAYVDVRITEEWPLAPDYPEYRMFVLANEEGEAGGGSWRITRQDWPWYECSEDHLDTEAG